ncbi:MAG: hypothetical protein K9M45_11115 [Kiritimatiellales bacterium]|nr:hypothetical protein [Kiritimatiellales bacterium]
MSNSNTDAVSTVETSISWRAYRAALNTCPPDVSLNDWLNRLVLAAPAEDAEFPVAKDSGRRVCVSMGQESCRHTLDICPVEKSSDGWLDALVLASCSEWWEKWEDREGVKDDTGTMDGHYYPKGHIMCILSKGSTEPEYAS